VTGVVVSDYQASEVSILVSSYLNSEQ